MAVWKKLNTETGEYEAIPGASVNGDTGDNTGGITVVTIPDLSGKTVICMGDSYTQGMSAIYTALFSKYGATVDNRGIVSSSISGDTAGSRGFSPMWNRTNSVCSEYTSAGTTDNVGAIVFMGGANDGFGSTTWLGSGTNDKDTNHIYGAMHSILKAFRNTFDCPIFVILQPYFPNGATPDASASEETAVLLGFDSVEQMLTFDATEYAAYSMQKKQKVVKEMAEFYNCHIVDCCFAWESIFRSSDRSTYWGSDGHPTAAGYQNIANDLEAKMLEAMGTPTVSTVIPAVPTNVSAFVNDAGYLTGQDLTDYAKKSEIPAKLPNPSALTINGQLYDGSAPVEIDIADSVSAWMDEHPEATTTVQDGVITRSKMSDDLLTELGLEPNHHLTEVKLTIHNAPYNSWWAGTDTSSATSTELFETPQFIRIVNNHNCDILKAKIRFADIADYDNATFLNQDLGKYHQMGYLQETIPMGEERILPTYEWGSVSRKYMQISYQPSNWNGAWNNIEIYAIYDTWRPTYDIPNDAESKEIFLEDLPMKWVVTSHSGGTTAGVHCAVPYYPGFTYHIRGGYYANNDSNQLEISGIYDDISVFDEVVPAVVGMSETYSPVNSFNISRSYGYTTQYDTSVNGGRDSAYQWAYWQAPAQEEISGLKWILIQFNVGDLSDGSLAPVGRNLTQEQADYILAQWMSHSSLYQYISRWQNKDMPRKPTTLLRVLNPNLNDDGSIYQAFVGMDVTSPMKNSKWVLFGDSLTDSYGGHNKTSNYFVAKIANEFAMDFDNRAKSGSNIYAGGSGNYTAVSGIVMLDAYLAEIAAGTTSQADYITVAFGTNTFAAQIGTNDDTSDITTSVYGATKYFIEKIRELVPNAVLGFVLSPRQDWGNADPNNTRSVDGGRAAIKTVCEDYGVPYIDMSTQSGITVGMLPDGIHISNDQSQKLYYHAMRRFMLGL